MAGQGVVVVVALGTARPTGPQVRRNKPLLVCLIASYVAGTGFASLAQGWSRWFLVPLVPVSFLFGVAATMATCHA